MSEKPVPIVVKDLSAGYGAGPVIREVSMKVERGDFVAIIGPNGGGKTTLLKTILGLIKPTSGVVKLFGKSPEESRHLVGYVPQHASFDKDYPITVREVVQMGRRRGKAFYQRYNLSDREKTRSALEDVSLLGYADEPISELSGGQKQRVFVARALASNPEVLLLDEPTASVDRKIEKGIYELLKEINKEMAIVVVTHDVGVMSSYITKIACLSHTLYFSEEPYLDKETLEEAYQCPVELVTRAGEEIPHRVLSPQQKDTSG